MLKFTFAFYSHKKRPLSHSVGWELRVDGR